MIRCWISFFPDAVPWQLTSPHSQRDVNNGLKLVHHVLQLHTRNCYMWPRPLLLSSLTWVHTYSIYWCEDQNIPSIADTSFHHDRQQRTTCKYIKVSPFHNLFYFHTVMYIREKQDVLYTGLILIMKVGMYFVGPILKYFLKPGFS